MAKGDIISRLKLESGEFDSKIKRAGQELLAYSEHCRKTGLQMGYANRDAKEFAKSLGSMGTVSNTARGKINELSDAFVNVRVMYKNMTDEERKSDFGKNLAASLDQLKVRLDAAKKDLADVTQEMKGLSDVNVGGGGGFLSGLGDKMSGALQVFGGNLMTKGFEVATSAALNFINTVKDAAAQGIEMAKAGEGIRMAFERLNRPDLLDQLREATHGTVTDLNLMQQAVKFNDFRLNLNEMGTLLAFAQQKAKDTGQSVDYMVDSIVTGLGRQSLMILDNLGLSASQIKEQMKKTGDMTTAVAAIIREQMAEAGDYVETAADRAAKADAELKNAMVELGRTLMPIAQDADLMWTTLEIGAIKALNDGIKPMRDVLIDLKLRFDDIYDTVVNSPITGGLIDWLQAGWEVSSKFVPVLAELVRLKNALTSSSGDENAAGGGVDVGASITQGMGTVLPEVVVRPTRKTTPKGGGAKQELDELQKIQKKIADLTKEAYKADESRQAEIQKEIAGLQVQEQKLTKIRDLVTGKGGDNAPVFSEKELSAFSTNTPNLRGNNGKAQDKFDLATAAFATSGTSQADISAYISSIKSAIQDANLGGELYNSLTEKIKDATTMSTLLQELMERGVSGADLENIAQALKDKLLSPEGIDQESVQKWLEGLSRQIEEAGGVGLALNSNTGEVSDKEDNSNEQWKKLEEKAVKLTGGLSSVSSGLKGLGITIPSEVDQLIGAMNSVMQIIQGVESIISVFQVGATTANTAALATLTSAVIANTLVTAAKPFANGGIVPHAAEGYFVGGTHFSGDVTPIMANAGELVLNAAQQGNLAAQLQGGAQQQAVQPYTDGEQIFLGLQAYTRRSGMGELVFAKP